MGILEGVERKEGTERIVEEIMAENVPSLMKNNLLIQLAQGIQSKINSSYPHIYIIIKLSKAKTEGES